MRWSLVGLVLALVLSSVALTEATSTKQASAALPPMGVPAVTSQPGSPSFDGSTSTCVYDISALVKDPHYLIRDSVAPGVGRGGFSSRPGTDRPGAASSLPAAGPQTSSCKPTPQQEAELRHRAALALVDLVREKMLSLRADSPEGTSYWRQPGLLRLVPVPDQNLDQDHALVVAASPADHDQIRLLMADLREDLKIKIAVECRVVSLGPPLERTVRDLRSFFKPKDKSLEKILQLLPREALESATLQPDGHSHRVGPRTAFLDDKQVGQLIKAVMMAPSTVILTAPCVTVRNNQQARVEVMTSTSYVADLEKVTDAAGQVRFEPKMDQAPTGSWFHFCATASRDRRNVQMKMEFNSMRLEALQDVWLDEVRAHVQKPVTWQYGFDGTLVTPTDRTQVLVGQELPMDPRDPKGPRTRLILLITPRILTAAEEQVQG